METLKKTLLEGIKEMIGLCEQCQKMVEDGKIDYDLTDILSDELPNKSENLYREILKATRPELVP